MLLELVNASEWFGARFTEMEACSGYLDRPNSRVLAYSYGKMLNPIRDPITTYSRLCKQCYIQFLVI